MTDIYKTWKGYHVRTTDQNGRALYLESTRGGAYRLNFDHINAKAYKSKSTAEKHAAQIERSKNK